MQLTAKTLSLRELLTRYAAKVFTIALYGWNGVRVRALHEQKEALKLLIAKEKENNDSKSK